MIAKTISALALSTTIAASIANPSMAADGIVIEHETTESKPEKLDEHRRDELTSKANRTVDDFKRFKPPEVFEQVRDTIADIMEAYGTSNTYLTLDEAYVMAVALHYDVTASNYRSLGLSNEDFKWLKRNRGIPKRTDLS